MPRFIDRPMVVIVTLTECLAAGGRRQRGRQGQGAAAARPARRRAAAMRQDLCGAVWQVGWRKLCCGSRRARGVREDSCADAGPGQQTVILHKHQLTVFTLFTMHIQFVTIHIFYFANSPHPSLAGECCCHHLFECTHLVVREPLAAVFNNLQTA